MEAVLLVEGLDVVLGRDRVWPLFLACPAAGRTDGLLSAIQFDGDRGGACFARFLYGSGDLGLAYERSVTGTFTASFGAKMDSSAVFLETFVFRQGRATDFLRDVYLRQRTWTASEVLS